jgi:para-nitrobenzyl esterase
MPIGKEVLFWRAIPYAKPPVGELRWKAPKDPEPWPGVMYKKTDQPRAVQYGLFKRPTAGDEDCLYLNVWRPDSPETDLPVVVWIHGGGNTTGSFMALPDYSGMMPAHRQNVVFVGINYRLGPFGWFLQDDLAGEEGSTRLDRSGNFGLLDIMKALEWVRANISAFGGDPGNVTVSGESAGGINILSLLMSPMSEGLFDKAQIRSGGIMLSEPEEGFARGNEVLRSLLADDGLTGGEADAWIGDKSAEETAAYLRSQPAERILRLYEPRHFGMITMPLLFKDGTVLPEEGQGVFSTGDYPSKVPVMIGSNADEVRLFMAFSDRFSEYGDFYRAGTEYGSNVWKANGVDAIARSMRGNPDQPPIYVYHFRWGTIHDTGDAEWSVLPRDRGAKYGSCHALEIPFFAGTVEDGSILFDVIFFSRANEPGRVRLQDAILSYTGEFFRTGSPGTGSTVAELPEWTPWTNGPGDRCMVLDAGHRELILGMTPLEMTVEKAREILRSKANDEEYEEIMSIMDEDGPSLETLEKVYDE